MRLGFSVAIHGNPDVLLVDEVLAVGDEGFMHRCMDKFAEFKRQGKTILLVTHMLNLVERLCDDVLLLESGRKVAERDPKRVVGTYIAQVEKQEGKFLATSDARAQQSTPSTTDGALPAPVEAPSDPSTAGPGRWGSGGAIIQRLTLLDKDRQPVQVATC